MDENIIQSDSRNSSVEYGTIEAPLIDTPIMQYSIPDELILEDISVVADDGNVEISGSDEARAEMFGALGKYFAEVGNPENNADNPFFKSKYAPLSEVLNTIRPVMGKYGLALIQSPKVTSDGMGSVQTILTHESGTYMSFPSLTGKPAKADIQGMGAVITYLRRFSVNAIAGVAGEVDDDGNAAAGVNKKSPAKTAKKTTAKAKDPLKENLIAECAKYTQNDSTRRQRVIEALKQVEPKGDVNKITTEADIKKALDIVKNLE